MLILNCTYFNRKFFAYDELKTPALAFIYKSGLTISMPLHQFSYFYPSLHTNTSIMWVNMIFLNIYIC